MENIFHLSFLIRDGKAAFETVDGEPVVCKQMILPLRVLLIIILDTCEAPGDDDYAAGLRKNQMILEFDIATWKASYCLSPRLLLLTVLCRRQLKCLILLIQ